MTGTNRALEWEGLTWDQVIRRGQRELRFWQRIEVVGSCWLWTGPLNNHGYGTTRIESDGPKWLAHRLAYELLIGPIPSGMELDHLCRIPACINPAHLEPVTHQENMLRSHTFVAEYSHRDRCINGHLYTPENTRLRASRNDARECRACGRERARRRASQNRLEGR